jgi:TonB family protein
VRARLYQVAAVVTVVGLCGCPPPPKKPKGGTTVTVEGGETPDYPGDFQPGEPLGDPPAPDPGQFGLAYLEKIYPAISGGWGAFLEDARLRLPPDHALNSPTLEAKIEIVVDDHGGVERVTRLSSSGNADFDQVAEEVAREAGPFPAPPRELLSDDDKLYVTWLFARDRRQAGVATAELRRTEWPLAQAVPKFIESGNLTEAARRLQRAAGDGGAATGPEAAQLDELATRVMVAALREGLRSEDVAVQRIAIDGVIDAAAADGTNGREVLAPAARELRSIADGSVEIEVRARAIVALGAIGDRDAVTFLADILAKDQGANPALSGAAAGALVTLGAGDTAAKTITGWLKSGQRAQLGGALATLARAAVPGTTAEIAKQTGHTDLGVRIAACGALGTSAGLGKDANAWKGIRKGLDDRDATVRAACARAAADAAAAGARNKTAYWRLVELFKDRDSRVRGGAVLAAMRLSPTTVGQELARFGKEKDVHVLAALAEGYAVVPGDKGAPPKRLVDLAGHADADVRVAAVRALASRKEPAAQKVAASLIVDNDLEVRLAALDAIDDPEQLATLSKDATPEVAAAAESRRLVRLGRRAALGEALGVVAESPASSGGRVRAAAAWLRASA